MELPINSVAAKAASEGARIARRVKQLEAERARLSALMDGTADMIDIEYAVKVEEAKIRVCSQRFQARTAALSYRAALSFYVRSLYYSDMLSILKDPEFAPGFYGHDPEPLTRLARQQLSIEDEWAATVERAHPINLYWQDGLLVSRSEYRVVKGAGWACRDLRMCGQITEASSQRGLTTDNIMYHALMVTSFYNPHEPWFESPVDFYSRDDAKAWAEEFIRSVHKSPEKEG